MTEETNISGSIEDDPLTDSLLMKYYEYLCYTADGGFFIPFISTNDAISSPSARLMLNLGDQKPYYKYVH